MFFGVNMLFIWLYFCEFKSLKVPKSYWAAINNIYSVHKVPNDTIFEDILQKKFNLLIWLGKNTIIWAGRLPANSRKETDNNRRLI